MRVLLVFAGGPPAWHTRAAAYYFVSSGPVYGVCLSGGPPSARRRSLAGNSDSDAGAARWCLCAVVWRAVS